jgi:hypothetical protein
LGVRTAVLNCNSLEVNNSSDREVHSRRGDMENVAYTNYRGVEKWYLRSFICFSWWFDSILRNQDI